MSRFVMSLLKALASGRTVVAAFVGAALLTAAQPAGRESSAQTATSATPPPLTTTDGIQAVIDDYVEALGGHAALDRLKTRRADGYIEIPNRDYSSRFLLYWEWPNHAWLGLLDPEDVERRSGFNGKTGWREGSSGWGTYEVLSARGIQDLLRTVDPLRYANLREMYPNLVREVMEPGDTRAAIVLRAAMNGAVHRYFFDSRSHLLVEIEDQTISEASPRRYQFTEYRRVDGVKFPHIIHEIVPIPNLDPAAARIERFIHYKKVVHNQKIPADTFLLSPGLVKTPGDGEQR